MNYSISKVELTHYQTLSSLRFVFFIGIFLTHYVINGERVFVAGGPIGVTFFFILSGFTLSLGYGERVDEIEMGEFLKKRLIKLYPMHLLTLFIRVVPMLLIPLLMGENVLKQIVAFFLNLTLLHAWIPDREIVFNYNMIAWFVSPIVFFYFVFPTLYKAIMRCKASILGFCSVFVIAIYLLIAPLVSDAQLYLYVAPYSRVLDFAIGIVLFRIYSNCICSNSHLKICMSSVKEWYLSFLLISSFALFIIYYDAIDECYRRAAANWIPVAAIILSAVTIERSGGGKILKNELLVKFGGASYEMYMIHAIIISVFNHIGDKNLHGNPFFTYGWMIICLITTVLVGQLLHNSFCLPIVKRLSNR